MSNKITMPWKNGRQAVRCNMALFGESRNKPLPYSVVEQHFQQCGGSV